METATSGCYGAHGEARDTSVPFPRDVRFIAATEAAGPPTGAMNARPRLLVVPHVSAEDVAVREVELACRLTEHFDVYCLEWSDAVQVTHPSPLRRRWRQLRTALGAATARF